MAEELFALDTFPNEFWTREGRRALGFSSVEDFHVGFLEAHFRAMDADDPHHDARASRVQKWHCPSSRRVRREACVGQRDDGSRSDPGGA